MANGNLSHAAQKAMKATKRRSQEASKANKQDEQPATGYQLGHLSKTMRDHTRDQSRSQSIAPQRTSLT